jgi:hypothetical protein
MPWRTWLGKKASRPYIKIASVVVGPRERGWSIALEHM